MAPRSTHFPLSGAIHPTSRASSLPAAYAFAAERTAVSRPCCRLQPIKETREKQTALWCELILDYCRHQKVRCTPQQGTSCTLFSRSCTDISYFPAVVQVVDQRSSGGQAVCEFRHQQCVAAHCLVNAGSSAQLHASGLTLPAHCRRAAQSGGKDMLPLCSDGARCLHLRLHWGCACHMFACARLHKLPTPLQGMPCGLTRLTASA